MSLQRISIQELIQHDRIGFFLERLEPQSQTVQTLLDALHPTYSEVFIDNSSVVYLRRDDLPEVSIISSRSWSRAEVFAFLEEQKLPGKFKLRFQGPDCEIKDWIISDENHEYYDLALLPIKDDIWNHVRGSLRRQIRKGEAEIRSFTMESYTPETWKSDFTAFKKFILLNDKKLRDIAILPELFEQTGIPEQFKRTVLKTSYGEMTGITSCWGKTWTADYHWSFHRYRAREINMTTLYHWSVINEAKKHGVEYFHLGLHYKNHPGLRQYKSLWNPDYVRTYAFTTSSLAF